MGLTTLFCRPLRGLYEVSRRTTAYGVGFILAPLRGLELGPESLGRGQLSRARASGRRSVSPTERPGEYAF